MVLQGERHRCCSDWYLTSTNRLRALGLDHPTQAYPKLDSLSAMANPLSKEPNSNKERVG